MLRLSNSATRLPTLKPFLSLSKPHLSLFFSTNKDDWNDAWETAWLPEDDDKLSGDPWDNSGEAEMTVLPSQQEDPETTAFVAEMNENWEQRRKGENKKVDRGNGEVEKRDYRLKKQRIHSGLWMKEIEKLEEAKLGGFGGDDDIDKLLDSCSEIFDSANNDMSNQKVPGTSEFKNKPDGWETTSKSEDGSVWEMSQREEDILLQEFERRMAFCKFQIASFIKTHIFSRRRPIDGWKYMIEVIGPNAKKGKGSVSRLTSLADPATQPFKEDRAPDSHGRFTSSRGR